MDLAFPGAQVINGRCTPSWNVYTPGECTSYPPSRGALTRRREEDEARLEAGRSRWRRAGQRTRIYETVIFRKLRAGNSWPCRRFMAAVCPACAINPSLSPRIELPPILYDPPSSFPIPRCSSASYNLAPSRTYYFMYICKRDQFFSSPCRTIVAAILFFLIFSFNFLVIQKKLQSFEVNFEFFRIFEVVKNNSPNSEACTKSR